MKMRDSIPMRGVMTMTVDKRVNKKEGEELREYMEFRRRGYYIKSKKGKGSFKRYRKHDLEKDCQNWQSLILMRS